MLEQIVGLAVIGSMVAFGGVKLWLGRRQDQRLLTARYRAAETADLSALQQAISILEKAGTAIIREDIERGGGHHTGDPKWTKLYHARVYVESQLNDVISLAMGEKLK